MLFHILLSFTFLSSPYPTRSLETRPTTPDTDFDQKAPPTDCDPPPAGGWYRRTIGVDGQAPWHGSLVGGVHGFALGAFFSTESRFSTVDNGSKIDFYYLTQHLRIWGCQLVDIQCLKPNTKESRHEEMVRCEYLNRLQTAFEVTASFI